MANNDQVRQELLNVNQVAKMLGFTRTRFYEWVKEHPEFPQPVSLSKNIKKYKRTQIDAFIDLLRP